MLEPQPSVVLCVLNITLRSEMLHSQNSEKQIAPAKRCKMRPLHWGPLWQCWHEPHCRCLHVAKVAEVATGQDKEALDLRQRVKEEV